MTSFTGATNNNADADFQDVGDDSGEKHRVMLDKYEAEIRAEKRQHQVNKNSELKTALPTYDELNTALKNEKSPRTN